MALLPVTVWAQMAGMDMNAKKSGTGMADMNAAGMQQMNLASGTSQNPLSWPMPMAMYHYGRWNFMFMANAFLADTQQSGPRGADKLYSANWLMASASHRVGAKGSFNTELMLSLEPLTVTSRRYPLLFQTGETAYGEHLVDAQHPHNFVMGLGFRYTHEIADQTFVTLYAAPVGDPALGPPAFPHRASAMELPQAAISHHWQDSTHIADEVVTVGISHRQFRLEASGFRGREPGEDRWIIESGAIDSWSGRLWYLPSKNWVAQFSGGRIAQPEGPGTGDQIRLTSSVEYTRPIGDSAWSTSLIWGRNHDTGTHRNLNSYLVESVVPVGAKNFLTGRAELVDKDELFATQPAIESALDATAGSAFRIGGYTIGYTRDFALWDAVQTGIGFNVSTYSLPSAIRPYYGDHPVGGSVFLRVRLKGHQ
ncbi:MAG TPA: hypothetical protein VHC72_14315 [Bryobacteraceae bacterium]|nr:hypothetical protein [Bryobacteraceae bacterium]